MIMRQEYYKYTEIELLHMLETKIIIIFLNYIYYAKYLRVKILHGSTEIMKLN